MAAREAAPKDAASAARKTVAIFEPYVFDTLYGNTRYIATIFQFVDRASVDPVLVSPVEGAFLDRIAGLGGDVRVVKAPAPLDQYGGALPSGGPLVKARALLKLVRYWLSLARFFRERDVEIVQCHNLRAMLMAAVPAKLTGRRVLYYVKSLLNNPILDPICFALADRVLFQGEANMWRRYPWAVRRFRHKIAVLGNGIDLGEIAEAEAADKTALTAELGLQPDRTNIVFVGQIKPVKGLDELVEAVALLQRRHPDTVLYIVGDHGADFDVFHDYRKALEARIAALGLNDVVFTGYRADVHRIVALMDVFVRPSHDEGIPKAAIEAMALGKPVIATDVGSVPDLIADGETGLLVPPGDSTALADALIRMVGDPALRERLGRQGRAFVERECAIQSNIRGLEQHYRSLE